MARRARLGFVLWCIIAPSAHGLGLGDIDLKSALNQPLSAEIGLVSATPEELGNLKVELAGRDTFDRYGIDRPEFLTDLAFRVGKDGRGRDIVRVTSTRAITEPFVTMLVEATWPRGRLLREYTVLLDPPVLLPQQAASAPVQAPQAAPQPSRQIQRGPAPQPSAPAPAPSQSMPRPTPAPAPSAASNPGTYGPVQRNQTLWGIATQLAPAGGATVNQMMVSLYRANPEAFDGNINRLRRGAVLRVPTPGEISDLSVSQATAEVRRQNESFAGAAPAPEPRLRLREPTAADAAAPTTASGAARATGSSAADRAEISRLRDEVEERDRLISVRDAELQALQEELERLRGEAAAAGGAQPDPAAEVGEDTATPGVDLSNEEIFAEEDPAEADPLGVDTAGEEAADAQQPPAQPSTQVVTTVTEEGLLDRVLGFLAKPLAWIIGGVLALGLLGFVMVKRRGGESAEDITGRWDALEAETDEDTATRDATERMRRKAMEDDSFVVEEPGADFTAEDQDELLEDIAEATGSHPAVQPAEPSSVNLDETLSSQTAINLDQADPVAEADFHMAYGLYDQAADLLGKALEGAPDRRDLKLKLIEVFFVWGNKDAFLEAARGFREEIGSGADTDWDKITIMGKQLCPGEELFAGTVDPSATMIDMDLDAGDSPALDFSLDDTGESKVDMDLVSDGDEEKLESADTLASTSGGLDGLDIGAQTAAGLEAVFELDEEGARTDTGALEDVDLDLSDTVESPTLETPLDDAETVESPYAEPTVESPTLENISPDAPTMETPTIETPAPDAPTVETPTLESESGELPTVEQPALRPAEQTAEIDLDDLGLDLEGLDDLSSELDDISDTREQPQVEAADDDLLSATGVTQVLGSDDLEDAHTEVLSDDDATMMAPGVDPTLTGATEALDVGEEGIDLDLDDLSAALEGGETVEQPVVSNTGAFSRDVFGGDSDSDGGLDLDVGTEHAGRDDPTATEEVGHMDPQTMTEVGTKLDLARAYIDMGDPEGARSILNEVLEEGDTTQQDEARTLMSGLG